MSDPLSDIRARLGATRQLDAVITAMRGVASARMREASERLAGVRAFSQAVGEAIASALALDASSADAPAARRARATPIVLAFCAEQGFAGAFSDKILTAARRRAAAQLFIIGSRGAALAEERGLSVAWTTPMASHVNDAVTLADRIADRIYKELGADAAADVVLIHATPEAGLVERPLLPLDFSRFPAPRARVAPLVTLPPRRLLAALAQEYVFAQLCEAAILSFAAENDARVQAMIAARNNVRKRLDALTLDYRRLRQEQITEEIIELAVR
jgi:F-type H+-transporting ATPase subunit gamma